jgi:hypothetical protein
MANLCRNHPAAKPYEGLPIAQRRARLLEVASRPHSTSAERMGAVDILLLLLRRRRGPHRPGQARRNS